MDLDPDQIGPSKDHELFCDPSDPNTLVMLQKIEHMDYFHQSYFQLDDDGKQIYKVFPNYYILDNIKIAHRQKGALHAMLKQMTNQQVMVREFCNLARYCYSSSDEEIRKFEHDFRGRKITVTEIIQWYTRETFFYKLLNRLLRASKDSSQLYYGQYFVKLLTKAITKVYLSQKKQKKEKVIDNFKCYRGAYYSQKQLEELQKNVGKHIETLGFLSTSLQKTVALGFLQNGNTLVEIDVSPRAAKDQELDLGYAYLDQQLSDQAAEEEIIFNFLSSFQIKSVGKFNFGNREVWHIKLEYGVTYQMMRKYKQNMMSPERGPAQHQRILAILSWQQKFNRFQTQEESLLQQNQIDKYIWLMKTKIHLYESIPLFQPCSEFLKQKLYKLLKPDKNLRNLNYQQLKQQINKYRKIKQKITSSALDRFLPPNGSARFNRQNQIIVDAFEIMANLAILSSSPGNKQKIKQELQKADYIKYQLLTYQSRYSFTYIKLNQYCNHYGSLYGLISQEEYWRSIQQLGIFQQGKNSEIGAIYNDLLIRTWKQASRHLQNRQWLKSAQILTQYRQKYFKGKSEQDIKIFKPICDFVNKHTTRPIEVVEVLQAALSLYHPLSSQFYRQSQPFFKNFSTKLKQGEIIFIQRIAYILQNQLHKLLHFLQTKKRQMHNFFRKNGIIFPAIEYLIVNTLRMLGRYEQADIEQVKLSKKHPAFYQQLQINHNQQSNPNRQPSENQLIN